MHIKSFIFFVVAILLISLSAGCAGPAPSTEEQEQAETANEPAKVAEATEPAPEPKQEPAKPVIVTIPAGTEMEVAFLDGLSSNASKAGDTFRTQVLNDVVQDGMTVIPAGALVTGTVLEAVSLKKIGGKALLNLEFNGLELPTGATALIDASFAVEGKSETKKDAATIGGAAAGGAVLGRMLKRDDEAKGTLIGAIVGAAAGTAIAAKTEGEEIELPAGMELVLVLNRDAAVAVEQ